MRKIDAELPSPAQFDHVITAVPQGGDLIWLDTTPEVAPFRFLLFNLRDKLARVVPPGKPAYLVKTPAAPPFPTSVVFNATGKLGEDGTLHSHMEVVARGDLEVPLRLAFRRTPQTKWKDLAQSLSYAEAFAGEVSNVIVSTPESTDQPFRYTYDYTRKDYSDGENKRIFAAVPGFDLPAVDDDAKQLKPIFLGAPGDFHYQSKIELPSGSTPGVLKPVNLDLPFAEYHSSYSFKDGVLSSDRRLITKLQEVPVAQKESYKSFQKTVNDERSLYTYLNASAVGAVPPNTEAVRNLDQARQAYQQRQFEQALDYAQRATVLDPQY